MCAFSFSSKIASVWNYFRLKSMISFNLSILLNLLRSTFLLCVGSIFFFVCCVHSTQMLWANFLWFLSAAADTSIPVMLCKLSCRFVCVCVLFAAFSIDSSTVLFGFHFFYKTKWQKDIPSDLDRRRKKVPSHKCAFWYFLPFIFCMCFVWLFYAISFLIRFFTLNAHRGWQAQAQKKHTNDRLNFHETENINLNFY